MGFWPAALALCLWDASLFCPKQLGLPGLVALLWV